MVAAPKRRSSPRLCGSSKRKAPEPQEVKLAAAAPAVTGAGDAIVEAPAAKAPKIEEPTAAPAAAPAPAEGWFASLKSLFAQVTGAVAGTVQSQASKAKARRAARQAARAKRHDAIKQRIMRLRQRK